MFFVHIWLHSYYKAVLQFNDNNKGAVIPVYAMKAYESIARLILNLSTGWRCMVSFMSQPLYLWEKKVHAYRCVGGWVDPSDSLDSLEKNKSISPAI